MLIHVTRFVKVQGRIRELIGEEMETLGSSVQNGDPALLQVMEQAFRSIWQARIEAAHPVFVERLPNQVLPLPEWDVVWQNVPAVFERLRVMKVNGTAKDALEYTRNPQGIYVIAVGGDKLSRGLTLEGLSVSYFLRASKLYDTLMQMGRWFGYVERYAAWRYSVESLDVYQVTQDFPRIAPKAIPGGVEHLTYFLRLAALNRWKQNATLIVGSGQTPWGA